MSTATYNAKRAAIIPERALRTVNGREQPPDQPCTVAACRAALTACGAMHHLFAHGVGTERRRLEVDVGHGPTRMMDGYQVRSEDGQVQLGLIPGVLAGTYHVAPSGGLGYMPLGVQVDGANGELALVSAEGWQRTTLGCAPFRLPCREVLPRGTSCWGRIIGWSEYPVPGQGLLTWCADELNQRRCEGGTVMGWAGVHRTPSGDLAVFIKVIKEPAGLAYILENERYLRRAQQRNPALAAFAPLATAVWTYGIDPIIAGIPDLPPHACAVMTERLITGPSLADLACGFARLRRDSRAVLQPRQIASCGRLAAQGLCELNRLSPRGERLLAPDATKLDNLLCQGVASNAYGEAVPQELVCPDRDHYISELNPRWHLRATMFGCDVRTLRAMMAGDNFDLVDPAHVFQVGRMLLALATGGALPIAGEDYGPDVERNLEIEPRHYARVLAEFDARWGDAQPAVAGTLGSLIRSCCDDDVARRPSLVEVAEACRHIGEMRG